ncbi:hypothetical protein HY486_04260 [Candidatus Woesearchaeota archaeon]|nr:hypothetical protein [Candidatus Woesearchaeota archaeon]
MKFWELMGYIGSIGGSSIAIGVLGNAILNHGKIREPKKEDYSTIDGTVVSPKHGRCYIKDLDEDGTADVLFGSQDTACNIYAVLVAPEYLKDPSFLKLGDENQITMTKQQRELLSQIRALQQRFNYETDMRAYKGFPKEMPLAESSEQSEPR